MKKSWGGGGGGGQRKCERRSEAFVKIQKKNFFFWGGVGGGGQGGCELRSEAFVKIKKKKFSVPIHPSSGRMRMER